MNRTLKRHVNVQALGSLQNLEGLGGPFRGLLDSLALATSEWRAWFQTDAPQVCWNKYASCAYLETTMLHILEWMDLL